MKTYSFETVMSELTNLFNLKPSSQRPVRQQTVKKSQDNFNSKQKELEDLLLKRDEINKELSNVKLSVGSKRVLKANLFSLEIEINNCKNQLKTVETKFEVLAFANMEAAKSKLQNSKEKTRAIQFLLNNQEQIFEGIKAIFLRLEETNASDIKILKVMLDKKKFCVNFMSLLRQNIENNEFKYLLNNCPKLQYFLSNKMYDEYQK